MRRVQKFAGIKVKEVKMVLEKENSTEKVKECKQILAEYEKSVRSVPGYSKITLNGPQGTVSSVTVRSVDMPH